MLPAAFKGSSHWENNRVCSLKSTIKLFALCCKTLVNHFLQCYWVTLKGSSHGENTESAISSSSAFPARSQGFTIFGEFFVYVTVFQSNHRGSHIPWVCNLKSTIKLFTTCRTALAKHFLQCYWVTFKGSNILNLQFEQHYGLDIGTEKTASTSWTELNKSQSSDWELDAVNSSPTSTDWNVPIEMNVDVAQVLKPPPTPCSPAPPSTLWDTRHGPVRWMPTGSSGDRLRHCGRLRTSLYSPDWRSSMAGNSEEEMKKKKTKKMESTIKLFTPGHKGVPSCCLLVA